MCFVFVCVCICVCCCDLCLHFCVRAGLRMLLCGGVYVGVYVYVCSVFSVCAGVCSVVVGGVSLAQRRLEGREVVTQEEAGPMEPEQHLHSVTRMRKPCSASLCIGTRACHWPPVLSGVGQAQPQAPFSSPGHSPSLLASSRPGPVSSPLGWCWLPEGLLLSLPQPLPLPEPPVFTMQNCIAQPQGEPLTPVCANSVSRPVTCTTQSLQASCVYPDPRLASSCGPLNNSERRPCWSSDRGDKERGGMHCMECVP